MSPLRWSFYVSLIPQEPYSQWQNNAIINLFYATLKSNTNHNLRNLKETFWLFFFLNSWFLFINVIFVVNIETMGMQDVWLTFNQTSNYGFLFHLSWDAKSAPLPLSFPPLFLPSFPPSVHDSSEQKQHHNRDFCPDTLLGADSKCCNIVM